MRHKRKYRSNTYREAKQRNLKLLNISPGSDLVEKLLEEEWVDYSEFLDDLHNARNGKKIAS